MNWKLITPLEGDDPWELSMLCDALYESPVGNEGTRLGPLVPYAGKDEHNRNLVGWVYFNFMMIEEHPRIVRYFAKLLDKNLSATSLKADTVVGIPDGGRTLGQELALVSGARFVYPIKVEKPTPPGVVKKEYDLVFGRSTLSPGERVVLNDDVGNNFNNTDLLLDSIGKTGAEVVGLCYALNRSPFVDDIYVPKTGVFKDKPLPVISAIRKPLLEYRQDDPEVAEYFNAGNIERNVKANWAELKAVMLRARGTQGQAPFKV